MRVLLDECLDERFRNHLPGHDCQTARYAGVTAQPDLWVSEGNTQVLLKIGIAKHTGSYVDMLLSLLRKAAIKNRHKVRAKNIVYLDVATGRELICSGALTRFNGTFAAAARNIAHVWPNLSEPQVTNRRQQDDRGHA